MTEMDKDVAACEAKLGKEPEILSKEKKDGVVLSESIAERLKTGTVEGDRLDNYDNYWMNKLACIDESHSARNNLDIEEAEEKLQSLAQYAEFGFTLDSNAHEMENKDRLKDCFASYRGESLKCDATVEDFIAEVDRFTYAAVRKDASGIDYQLSDKKLSYMDRFKRNLQL